MTRKATFGGRAALLLADGDVLHGAIDDREHLRIRREDISGATVWEADLGDLGEDPSLQHADSQASDYACLYRAAADTLILVGDTAALALSATTGSIAASYELKPVGKVSLEVSGVSALPENDAVLISSAKRVWMISSDLKPIICVDANSLLADFPGFEIGVLIVNEYDFESVEGRISTRRVPVVAHRNERG